MQMGGPFPGAPVPILHLQGLSRSDRSLALSSVRRNLEMAASRRQMRRLVGPTGGGGRQDASGATELDVNSSDDDFDA